MVSVLQNIGTKLCTSHPLLYEYRIVILWLFIYVGLVTTRALPTGILRDIYSGLVQYIPKCHISLSSN
jgi:hypothetical protein